MNINSIKTKDRFHNFIRIKQLDNTSPIEVLLCDSTGALLSNLNEKCTVSIYDAISREVRQVSDEQIVDGVLSFKIVNELLPCTHKLEVTTFSGVKFPADDDFQIFVSESHNSKLINVIKSIPTELALKVVTQQVMNRFNSISDNFVNYIKKGEVTVNDLDVREKKITKEYISDDLINSIQSSETLSRENQSKFASYVKKGEVTVRDIDKNKGLLDQTYFTEETKRIWTGNAPVNAVPADGSVTTKKLAFVKPGKNLFNPEKVIDGVTINAADGTLKSDVGWANVTEHINVEANQTYILNTKFTNVALYSSTGTFIKSYVRQSSTLPTIIETTNDTTTIRATIYDDSLNAGQIEKGHVVTAFESYTPIIKKEYVEHQTITASQLPKIEVKHTALGVNVSKNLVNPDKVKVDTGINSSGSLVYNSTHSATEMIPVTENTKYMLKEVVNHEWYDSAGQLIKFTAGGGIVQSPPNAKYLVAMFKKENLNTVMIAVSDVYLPYERYREVIGRQFLDLPSSSNEVVGQAGIGYTTSFNQSDLALAEQNAYNLVPNVSAPLNIPTYEGSGAATHPSVLYFKNGWNGYKFWMAFTPYPNSNNKFENPSIVASNDNVTWVAPATNPIAPLLPENTYQSDPCIFMNGNKMEMWYRVSTINPAGGYYPTEMFRMTTNDGVNWTAREKMFDGSTFGDEFLAQTIRMKDGKYMMWLVFKDKTTNALPVLMYAESTDGKTWTKRILNVALTDSAYTFWHGDIIENPNGGYDFIVMCKSDTKKWATFYTYSPDNINWTTPVMIIKSSYPSNKYWDSTHLYRPALVYVDNQYYVYYTTPSNIGLTKGKTLLTLGLDNIKMKSLPELVKCEQYIAPLNAFPATATFDKYPTNSITIMPVWSSTDAGWAELSGTVRTENLLNESNKAVQYFYPTNKSTYYYFRNATSTGWSSWYKYSGSPM